MTISILIPAAGASSRMRGRDKLMELVNGRPLLQVVAERAVQASDDVVVTVPNISERAQALTGLSLKVEIVEDAEQGMSASIRTGVASLSSDAHGVMILPADMPDISLDDIVKVIHAFDIHKDITVGCSDDGQRGHPVIFPRSDFQALKSLSGDQGAKSLLHNGNITKVPLPNNNALTDLDTPKDWEEWRSN